MYPGMDIREMLELLPPPDPFVEYLIDADLPMKEFHELLMQSRDSNLASNDAQGQPSNNSNIDSQVNSHQNNNVPDQENKPDTSGEASNLAPDPPAPARESPRSETMLYFREKGK